GAGVRNAAALGRDQRGVLDGGGVTCRGEVNRVQLVGILMRANVPVYPQERAMSTSPVYDSTRAALRQQLPTVIDSQLDSLSLAMVGVMQSMSSQLAKIARAMPLDTTARAKEQRLRRLLDN